MKNFSKFALTSIAALTVASPLVNTEVDAKDKVSATQNIDAKVTQESQATNALKELPKSEDKKIITKIIRSLILKKITKDLRITHCNRKWATRMHPTKK